MTDYDAFTSAGISKEPREFHRREAARIRTLATAATTEQVRRGLENRAREHERLAGDSPS
jgi:hypothetical protein